MNQKLPSISNQLLKERYTCPQLPLAVYREVAAHLRQVTGVNAGLIVKPLQGSKESFDYCASQIDSLWLEYAQDLSLENQQRIRAILDYYGKRYQPWQKRNT